jgi:hypothetical protein
MGISNRFYQLGNCDVMPLLWFQMPKAEDGSNAYHANGEFLHLRELGVFQGTLG